MNKRKRTGRIALALLISGIVFLTNTIAMLLTIVAIYGLARLGVIETTGGQVGLPELLNQSGYWISSRLFDRKNHSKTNQAYYRSA